MRCLFPRSDTSYINRAPHLQVSHFIWNSEITKKMTNFWYPFHIGFNIKLPCDDFNGIWNLILFLFFLRLLNVSGCLTMWFFSVSFNFEAKLAAKIQGGGKSFGRKLYKLQQLKLLRHHHRCYANDVLIKKAKLNYGDTEFDL